SVAAARLVGAGHRVVGATLRLWGGESDSGCCSAADADDARRVAQVLGIDHHVFNYAEEFEREVVAPYVAAHREGLTPNPCVACNRAIKFDHLLARARRLGFDALATGHHARVVWRAGRATLARATDPAKDQSYVLGHLGAEALARLVLPVGTSTKAAVRAEARELGLRTWDKPESQDACFAPTRTRAAFLASRLALTPARVVDADGTELGRVDAAELVTVGQRRGIARGRDGAARYVTRIDVAARRVDVATDGGAATTHVALAPGTLSLREPALGPARVRAQWSAHGAARAAELVTDGPARLILDEPARPAAPGQSVVLYRDDDPRLVLGAALVGR
ncbi:MAG TPA: tRNA 2-thiouridine(34) synthase MnmA, partial [Acidimicrobiales bacterium]|nr:tRNA 2-thiouridine(34) synthase MnmA [Acidimicrobiales bacterium]